MNHAPASPEVLAEAREAFGRMVEAVRPKLHRYCARMTGSVIDAEDVVQDALAKAYYLLPTTEVANLEAWLMTIAHNKAIDHIRKRRRQGTEPLDDVPPQAAASEAVPPLEARETAQLALSVYLQLTPMQRSCVILKDVMGYSLAEVSEMLDASVGAIKAALHRGRENLRRLATSVDEAAPQRLGDVEARLLARYVDRFNARDFDAVRAMLADDVRLDLVEREERRGAAQVAHYYTNYGKVADWHLSIGFVEGRPAVLVADPATPDEVAYFMLIRIEDGKVAGIRDYRYTRHVMIDAVTAAG